MHGGDCEVPLVLGLHVCVPPKSGCLGLAEAARVARTPCKEKSWNQVDPREWNQVNPRECVGGENVVDFFSFVGLQHEVSGDRLLDITHRRLRCAEVLHDMPKVTLGGDISQKLYFVRKRLSHEHGKL